jgi:hypothetical protein
MAEVVLRLVVDPDTGQRTIVVDYHSTDDSIPVEHEAEHRRIVEDLAGRGLIGKGDKVVVTRDGESAPVTVKTPPAREGERKSVGEGES